MRHGCGQFFVISLAGEPPALQLALARTQALALPQLSLIVFERNAGAKRLYDRFGFRPVRREPVVPHPLIHHTGDVLLLVKDV